MRYAYASTFADFQRAQKIYLRNSPWPRALFHFWMWGVLLLGIVFLLVFSAHPARPHTLLDTLEAGLVGGCFTAGILLPLIRPVQMRRMYRTTNGPLKTPVHAFVEIQNTSLISGIEGKSETRLQRPAVCRTLEDDSLLLLFIAKKRFLYLPKHDLSSQALNEIYGWLKLPGAPNSC